MKKIFIAMILFGILMSGCISDEPQKKIEDATATPVPTEKAKPDVSDILNDVTELREEKIYLVTLEFAKESFTLDPFEMIANEIAAEHRVLMVSERTYEQYEIGKRISAKLDGLDFFFNFKFSEYVIRPVRKEVISQYFWQTKSDTKEISKDRYDEALRQLKETGKEIINMPYMGAVRNYVLDKPLDQYEIVNKTSFDRYFITVEVKSETFTMDLVKLMRNEANAQEITIEVPKEVYDKTGDVWDQKLSGGSFLMKGHISTLRGRIVKKWQEKDNSYVLVTTSDGKKVHNAE